MGSLLSQYQKPGGLAVLEYEMKYGKRYIYYLVTKKLSHDKPTYGHFWSSLKKMRDHVVRYDVKNLAMPKLGCGLDRLDWAIVKRMIEFLFRNVNTTLIVCKFSQVMK